MNQKGFTLLEVLIALFLLGLTITGLFQLLTTTDRAQARQKIIAYGTLLASNEAERIRVVGDCELPLHDTLYAEQINNIEFIIQTNIIKSAIFDTATTLPVELEIKVSRKTDSRAITMVRVLQGTL